MAITRFPIWPSTCLVNSYAMKLKNKIKNSFHIVYNKLRKFQIMKAYANYYVIENKT